MCGISGIISTNKFDVSQSLTEMLESIKHRGPDGRGMKVEKFEDTIVGLGHVRLAILDLSDAALQPMTSVCGNYTLIYNGEIYNYIEIKEILIGLGYCFSTCSDTEVVLSALIEWGVKAFERFNGMWSLALLDVREQTLLISRDRFGIKPLYYFCDKGRLYFASEIKAVLKGCGVKFEPNPEVIYRFLEQSLLDVDDQTFMLGINKVPAGSYAKVNLRNPSCDMKFIKFWSFPTKPNESIANSSPSEAVNAVFSDAVKLRLRSDVPIGITLSGGIDSSCIAAKVCEFHSAKITTFSSVCDDKEFDEQPYIDIVNEAFKFEVSKVNVSNDPIALYESYKNLTYLNDEPLVSFSSVAFYQLMLNAKKKGVKVLLSGQGADEIFCGYRKYLFFRIKELLRKKKFFKLSVLSWGFWRRGTVFKQFSFQEAKRYMKRSSNDRHSVLGSSLSGFNKFDLSLGKSVFHRQIKDVRYCSVPSLLHYEDRLSMAASVEVRLPFLDHRLVDLALRIPVEDKLHKGWTKWVLRDALKHSVPKSIIWRKDKQGFSNPQEKWFKEDFKPKLLEMIGSEMLSAKFGFIRQANFARKYQLFCEGGRVSFKEIYNIFALEMWLSVFGAYLTPPVELDS